MRVAVIGKGILAYFATKELLAQGIEVTIFDAGQIRGASRSSSGSRVVTVLWAKESMRDLMTYGFDTWRELLPQLPDDCAELTSICELFPASAEGEVDAYIDVIKSCGASFDLGAPTHIAAFLGTPLGNNSEDWAVLRREAAIVIDCEPTLEFLWSQIESQLTIKSGVTVRAIGERSTKGVSIRSENGNDDFDAAIVATGAWTEQLLKDSRARLPQATAQLYLSVGEPPKDGNSSYKFSAAAFPVVRDYRDQRHYLSVPGIGQQPFKVFEDCIGPPRFPGLPYENAEEIQLLKEYLNRKFLGNVGPLNVGQCAYAMSPDYHAIVDFVPEVPSAICLVEPVGSGVRSAPALATVGVEKLLGKELSVRFPLSQF